MLAFKAEETVQMRVNGLSSHVSGVGARATPETDLNNIDLSGFNPWSEPSRHRKSVRKIANLNTVSQKLKENLNSQAPDLVSLSEDIPGWADFSPLLPDIFDTIEERQQSIGEMKLNVFARRAGETQSHLLPRILQQHPFVR